MTTSIGGSEPASGGTGGGAPSAVAFGELFGRPEDGALLAFHLLETSPIGTALTTGAGRVLWVNDTWCRMSGLPAAAAVALASGELVHPDDRDDDGSHARRVRDTGHKVEGVEQRWRRADGSTIWVSLAIAPAETPAGDPLTVPGTGEPVLVRKAVEITDQVELRRAATVAQAEVLRRNADLERSNEELAQFAYVISHDLSEPLRVITGHVQLIAKHYGDDLDPELESWMQYAIDGCNRLRALIDDLLEYSRAGREEPPMTPVGTNQMVRNVLGGLAVRVEETGAVVEVDDLPTIHGDRLQLAQIMANLLGNAMKFHRPGEAPHIRVTGEERPGWTSITVSDDGLGIPERHRERVFGVFQRLHARDAYPGTGIGLAVCRKIATRHGGTIEVRDSAQGGAAFTVTLPRPEQGAPAGGPAPADPTSGGGTR